MLGERYSSQPNAREVLSAHSCRYERSWARMLVDSRSCWISYWRSGVRGREYKYKKLCNLWVTLQTNYWVRDNLHRQKTPEMSWARIRVDSRRKTDIEREYMCVNWRNEWVTIQTNYWVMVNLHRRKRPRCLEHEHVYLVCKMAQWMSNSPDELLGEI